jgi:hypothetical protein
VGQVLSAVAGSVGGGGVTASLRAGALADTEDVLADDGFLSELQAASIMAADAAQTTSETEDSRRGNFTMATLPPRIWQVADPPRARGGNVHIAHNVQSG